MESGTVLQDQSGERGRERLSAAQIAAVVLIAVVLGIGAGFAGHFLFARSPSSPRATRPSGALHGEATWPAGTRPAPPITELRDQSGQRFSLKSLRGRTVAMEFFDSHCRQQCPLAGRALAAAIRTLPRTQRPVLVVVSVNPLDTPGSTRAALRAWGLAGAAPWHWLRGTHAQLAPVWKSYKIFVQPERGDISHTEALYLIDRRGDERSGYLYPYIPGFVAADLRTLASIRATRRG
jgi:cytochrome oxidase Cu insertion factor (SCO1/SenC/PrrC family)